MLGLLGALSGLRGASQLGFVASRPRLSEHPPNSSGWFVLRGGREKMNEHNGNGRRRNGRVSDDCIAELLLPDEQYVSQKKSPEREREHIRDSMSWQARDETITHLEKVMAEIVYGRCYDVWDVITDQARWWVITQPMNLYSQEMFPSMDMCLTFHIGLATRLLGTEEQQDDVTRLLIKSMRRLTAASEALDGARDVEQFQAVGVMLREALLGIVRDLVDESLVPSGTEEPKLGDFVHWSELVVHGLTRQGNLKDMRSALKRAAKDAWQSASALAHKTSADDALAAVCANQVRHVFEQWATLLRATVAERMNVAAFAIRRAS
jgi:hypothetical protein